MNILYSLLAAQGRNGDTELAHVTPEEQALLKSRGGAGTINPKTGLKEFNPEQGDYSERGKGDIPEGTDWSIQNAVSKRLIFISIYGEHGNEAWDRLTPEQKQAYLDTGQMPENMPYFGTDKYQEAVQSGDFTTEDLINMSDNELAAFTQNVYKGDTDFASFDMGDFHRYMPGGYDWQEEKDVYGEAGKDISKIGETAQSSLLSLSQSQSKQTAQRGYATTGNPMVDRQRENIFSGIQKDTTNRWDTATEDVTTLREDYHTEYEDALFDWIDLTNDG